MRTTILFSVLGLMLTALVIWSSFTQYWAATLSRIASVETSIAMLQRSQDRIEQRLDSLTMKKVAEFDYK